MANLGFTFDPNSVPANEYQCVAAGDYAAIIVRSEMCDTKAGTGKYLKLEFKLIDGAHKGAVLFTNLNLVNPSEQAMLIARQQLAEIQRAVGVPGAITDSQVLHNKPCLIRVDFRPASETRKYDENTIKSWKAIAGGTPQTASGTAQAANKSVPVWAR